MTQSKNTKRALVASVLSMLVCLSMLVGSTFAWFTDSVTTGVNRIQAGTLDVDLVDDEGNTLVGKKLDFKKAEGAENEDILWEPGCTYELPEVFVKNNGNLALKYKVVISGINGDAKLNEAIEWTINGLVSGTEYKLVAGATSEALTIKGHMKETAGNEYQGLSIDGIAITVVATQDTVEHDSYTDQYDAQATYYNVDENGNPLISTAGELLYFAQQVNVQKNDFAGKTVYLTNDIDMAGIKWNPIGQTEQTEFKGTFDGQNHTISNLTVDNSALGYENTASAGLFGWIENHNSASPTVIKNLTIDGANIVAGKFAGGIVGYTSANVTIENCTVTNSTISGSRVGGIDGYKNSDEIIKNCTVENVVLDGFRSTGAIVGNQNLEGFDQSKILDCTSTGVMLPSKDVEGLYTDGAGSYAVSSAEALKKVETAPDKNTSIKLQGDVDMGGAELESIFAGYAGTIDFDGNGNTIKNVAPVTDNSNGMTNQGMFSSMANTNITIKNVTIEASNMVVEGTSNSGNYGSAFLVGYNEGDLTIENVTIKNSGITGGYCKIGLFVGYSTGNVTIKNCTVENSTINGGRYGTCLVGQMNGKKLTIEKVTLDTTTVQYCGSAISNATVVVDGVQQ